MKLPVFSTISVSVFFLTGTAQADASAKGVIPIAQQQAYQVGYLQQLTDSKTHSFLEAVKTLRSVGDDAEAIQRIKDLAVLASTLRSDEAQNYRHTELLFQKMAAPPMIKSWVEKASKTLASPLVLSDEAKPYAKHEPEVAQILATLDEATALNAQMNNAEMSIATWLKLTCGADGLWAYHLGTTLAAVHVTLASRGATDYPGAILKRLDETAPLTMPHSTISALSVLALPHPIRIGTDSSHLISADAAWQAHEVLNKQFGIDDK